MVPRNSRETTLATIVGVAHLRPKRFLADRVPNIVGMPNIMLYTDIPEIPTYQVLLMGF